MDGLNGTRHNTITVIKVRIWNRMRTCVVVGAAIVGDTFLSAKVRHRIRDTGRDAATVRHILRHRSVVRDALGHADITMFVGTATVRDNVLSIKVGHSIGSPRHSARWQ